VFSESEGASCRFREAADWRRSRGVGFIHPGGRACGRFDFGKGMMSKGMFRKNHSIALDSFANFSVALLSERVLRGWRGDAEAGSEVNTARDEKTAEAGGSE